mmetsp:Transcript_174347/g.558909  ORF Transcript_174347/g.558909 Transcript_174347/m.558909 type:complete len:225 (+) Transcript_174347:738-1412(+)
MVRVGAQRQSQPSQQHRLRHRAPRALLGLEVREGPDAQLLRLAVQEAGVAADKQGQVAPNPGRPSHDRRVDVEGDGGHLQQHRGGLQVPDLREGPLAGPARGDRQPMVRVLWPPAGPQHRALVVQHRRPNRLQGGIQSVDARLLVPRACGQVPTTGREHHVKHLVRMVTDRGHSPRRRVLCRVLQLFSPGAKPQRLVGARRAARQRAGDACRAGTGGRCPALVG